MQAACLLGISRLSALCYANNRVGREAGWLAGLFVTRWRKPDSSDVLSEYGVQRGAPPAPTLLI